MNIIKKVISDWSAETPKIAKFIRNIAGTLTVVLPTAWGILTATGIMLPMFINNIMGYIILISAIITGIAGTKTKKQ